jgi:DNA-binding transcriptional LysR family regulator
MPAHSRKRWSGCLSRSRRSASRFAASRKWWAPPLLQRGPEGVRLTDAGTVLLEESRTLLSRVEQGVSLTRQAAGIGRPRLRVAICPGMPEAITAAAVSRLSGIAADADVDVAWLETFLDTEFTLIGQHRADAGLGWLAPADEVLPAPLDVMILGDFEPEAWIPSSHPAARQHVISLGELTRLNVVHGPRRASPGDLRRLAGVPAVRRPAVRVRRPAVPAVAPADPRLRGGRQSAHRRADRATASDGRAHCLGRPGRERVRNGPRPPRSSPAHRERRARVERRPATPASAGPLRHRRRHQPARMTVYPEQTVVPVRSPRGGALAFRSSWRNLVDRQHGPGAVAQLQRVEASVVLRDRVGIP